MRKTVRIRLLMCAGIGAAALSGSGIASMSSVIPAFANGSCGSTLTYGSDAWGYSGGGWGDTDDVQTRTGAFCSGTPPSGDIIASHAEMTDSSGSFYARAGYLTRTTDSGNYYFYAEYTGGSCGSFCRRTWGTVLSGYNTYTTTYVSPAMEMQVNGTDILNTSYDPTATGTSHWSGPWHEVVGSLAGYEPGDDVPGISGSVERNQIIGYQSTQSGFFIAFPSYNKFLSSRYCQTEIGSQTFDSYAGPC